MGSGLLPNVQVRGGQIVPRLEVLWLNAHTAMKCADSLTMLVQFHGTEAEIEPGVDLNL